MHDSDMNKGTFKSKWTDQRMVTSKFKDFNIENHPMVNLKHPSTTVNRYKKHIKSSMGQNNVHLPLLDPRAR